MKRTVKFLDKNHKLVTIECEITNRNGYPEFTMSGEWDGSIGQIIDDFEPASEAHELLVKFWKDYHLKDISKETEFEDELNTLLDEIEEAEEERKGGPISVPNNDSTEEEYEYFYSLLEEKTGLSDKRDLELVAAFIELLDLSENDLEDIEIDGTRCAIQGVDYTAGTDEEMDEVWNEELENYIDECILPEIPEHARNYFNNEAWKSDARRDGRGHALNHYDGGELETEIDNTRYYAYRQ